MRGSWRQIYENTCYVFAMLKVKDKRDKSHGRLHVLGALSYLISTTTQ